MRRRTLLEAAALAVAGSAIEPVAKAFDRALPPARVPVIDTHIHLFDTGRKGGVPWPEPSDKIYQPALPPRFEKLAGPLGVVGAIAIEASPLPGDNYWLLNVVEKSPVMVGMVGDLVPGSATYGEQLDQLRRNPLFLGIRYGNLWDRNLAADRKRAGFREGLKMLAQAGLVLDTANPDAQLIEAVVAIANDIPDLTIVMDHLPNAQLPSEPQARKAAFDHMRELGRAPHVYTKLSEVLDLEKAQGRAAGSRALSSESRDALDRLYEWFGPDKVLYGSDWPNSEHTGSYGQVFGAIHRYMSGKGAEASHKFFFGDSQRAYRWHGRTAEQGTK